jgi:hypothetical protein
LKSVKAGPQQVQLKVCFASAFKNNNCMALILPLFLMGQSGTTAEASDSLFASALKNNNCLAFMLTSYFKSVAAGPQQSLLTVKRQNRGKAEG